MTATLSGYFSRITPRITPRITSRIPSRFALSLVAALIGTMPLGAAAADDATQGNWMIRLRSTYLKMDDKSDPIGGVGASDRIGVNNKWIPEIDVTYFVVPHVALELMATVPQSQDVSLDGNKIGTFRHLPPALVLQYHFLPEGTFRPYVGAGVNVTRIYGANLAGNSLQLDRWSVGPVLQIGMDYKLTKHWFLNVDAKKSWISSNVYAGGTKVSTVNLDPWLFSAGVGYRF
ncbi:MULTISPECIES: OmpW/AlkL family protein [Cupriavidus]|uniref:OmpW family protein n=1 Tax=Cupriavidus pauculus TaxID=82633 RepID=A0A5P2HES6_9BURK|nr:OmpW family outer membrane protein [Cupriavidus pauculus]QET05649.1 OmpW family protein [Cupriavidus pauculus]